MLSSMFLQEQMELPEVPSEPLPEKIPGVLSLFSPLASHTQSHAIALRPSSILSIVLANVKEYSASLLTWAV